MKSFSELTSASQVNNEDLLAISQTSGSGYASKKTTVKDITDKSNLNLAEEYDSTSTYAVDDYVIYESVLYKCIGTTTGTFDSTKWTSVVVTDEMGSGGGGGTGGHTIIDENGNSMTARAGLQFTGGANVSDDSTNNKTIVDVASAGGIDGVFVDTDNVVFYETINDGSIAHSTYSYTATEDCIASILANGNSNGNVTGLLNGTVEVFRIVSSGVFVKSLIPMKKGQTLSFTGLQAYAYFGVYGIQTGTTHSKFQPVIYSTEEREIGVWTNGKPLYEKTLYTNTQVQLSDDAWTTIPWVNEPTDVDFLVSAEVTRQCPNNNSTLRFTLDSGHIKGASVKTGNYPALNNITEYLKIRYTKSTDTAGSGNWTPQGVPTHHYSTDEQIIGTYLGETLYEKTYTGLNITIINANTWYDTGLSASGIDTFIDGKMIDVNKQAFPVNVAFMSSNTKIGISCGMADRTGVKLTIQYTKSS